MWVDYYSVKIKVVIKGEEQDINSVTGIVNRNKKNVEMSELCLP